MERLHASVWPRASGRFVATVRAVTVVAAAGGVAFLLFAAPSRGAGPVVPFRIVLTNPAFATLAVDHRGVAYGVAETGATSLYRLYSSTDEGQTWTALADFPSCSRVTDLSVLSDDTLLAHVNNCSNVAIYRSADHGATWESVFTFPQPDDYRTLTPHSITDDGQAVYIGSYNTLDSSNHENWVWRSLDDGQTWQVVLDTTTHRHIHFVQADPTTHWVYVGYGDEGVGEIDVTRDQGATWSPLCTGDQCLAVDIAFDPSGFAIFGQDLPYGSDNIQRVNLATGAVSTIMSLPGISYSSMRLPGGVWLIGTTHGPGTAYVPGDLDVHLFASIDNGQTFSDVYDTPYDPNDCCYALKVQFAYPNGDFPIQVGGGTVVAHIDTSSSSPPANTSLPTISGSAVVGQLLSASTGVWSGNPSGYTYEWDRCDTTGAGCVAIGGATSAGYTLTLADVGATVRVAVTASNGGGSATAASVQTVVVAAAPAGGSFGQSQVGTLVDTGGAGYLDLSGPYAVSAAVSVSQLNGYLAGGSATSRLRGVIYTNSGGQPGTLVAATSEVSLAANRAAGWLALPLTAPVQLAAGSYWLGYWYADGNSRHYYLNLAGAERYKAAAYSSTANPPTSFGTASSASSSYSLTATYTTP